MSDSTIPANLRAWVEATAPTYTAEQWAKARKIADWNPQARALLAYVDERARVLAAGGTR